MALIKCKECGNEISKKAEKCPNCGAPAKKKTSVLTWVITVIFVLGFVGYINGPDDGGGIAPSSVASSKTYQLSDASYDEINSEVGCDSKYSDDKKEDLFNRNYKNHWMTWRGVVVLSEADEASLNIDGIGTQDLKVDFANPKAGYDLNKDTVISVKFLMKRAGGCFLPFSGERAVIVN